MKPGIGSMLGGMRVGLLLSVAVGAESAALKGVAPAPQDCPWARGQQGKGQGGLRGEGPPPVINQALPQNVSIFSNCCTSSKPLGQDLPFVNGHIPGRPQVGLPPFLWTRS
ncbi:hypothetical protein KKG48_04215 [Patescibacteria group bacterium]|nr:hypothetical protein [Patescibacteria group bacterium]